MPIETYELRIAYKAASQPCENVFHYRIDNTGSEEPWVVADQLIGALDDGIPPAQWLGDLLGCMSDQVFVSYIRCQRVGPIGSNSTDFRPDAGVIVGTVGEEVHAEQLCGCVIWISDTEPENQGRSFLPGVPETFLEGSRWKDAAYTAYDAFIEQHLVGFSLASGLALPAIFDRASKTSRIIANGYLSPKPGTQRRREKPL